VFGEKLVRTETFRETVIMPFIGKMHVLNLVLSVIETIDISDIRKLDLRRVLGPVLAVRDQ
jgi:hypothetical protein